MAHSVLRRITAPENQPRRVFARTLIAMAAGVLFALAHAGTGHAEPSSAEIEAQIDTAWNELEPIIEQFNKTCETVIDMTIGEGPKSLEATIGANVIFAARKEMVESNPKLMEAFYAAMTDAANWFNDPKNFDELVKIFTPIISFGDMAGADEMRKSWIKSVIPAYSKDLKVKVSALQEIMDFSLENKIIDVKVEASKVLWKGAPQTP